MTRGEINCFVLFSFFWYPGLEHNSLFNEEGNYVPTVLVLLFSFRFFNRIHNNICVNMFFAYPGFERNSFFFNAVN